MCWRLWGECLRSCLAPSRGMFYVSFQTVQTGSKTHGTSHLIDTGESRELSFPRCQMVLCDADHSHHLVSRLSMSGAIPTVPHMPSWYAQGQLCLCLYLYSYFCLKGTCHVGKTCGKCCDIWDMYASVFNSLFTVHVVYYRGQSRFHRDFKNQVDLRYSHSWREIPSSVTPTVDEQCTSAF